MSKRFRLEGEAIEETAVYDSVKDKYYWIDYFDEFVDMVNEQEEQLQMYKGLVTDLREGNTDLDWLLGVMQDYNLTWGAVANIVEAALDE